MTAPASGSKRGQPVDAAAAERRVQPRPFNSGTSPVAASDRDAAAASVHADGPSPAARLYRHALESVFAFLSQGELAFALRVSCGWLAAAHSMGSLQLKVGPPSSPVCVVAASAMGRHVAVLGAAQGRNVALDDETLSVVARLMPHLSGLFCVLGPPPPGEPLVFPAALRELEIDQPGPVSAAELNATLRAVGCLSRLESFTILLPTRLDPHFSFAPLSSLPLLHGLGIDWFEGGSLSDAQADELRTMPRLQQLSLSFLTANALRRLLRRPHDLHWQQVSLPFSLDDECAALLPQLPSLTYICCKATCTQFDWLRGLLNLTEARMSFKGTVGADYEGRAASLVAGLQCCTNIEKLTLHECPDLTVAHLADLLPRLPRLRELHLQGLSIDSLSFLDQPPLTGQLTSLHLYYCQQLPLTELRHVHALRGLKQLHLLASFAEWLDELSQSLYEPPSALLPQLEKFDFREEDDESEDE